MSENNSITTNIKNNNDDNNINTKNNDDIIKAKREARRRKILDNAASRLEKLNGNVASGSRSGNLKQQNSSIIQSNGNVKKLTTTTTATKNTTIMNNDQIPVNDPEIEYNSNNINFDELLFNQNYDVNSEEGAKVLNQFLNKIKFEIIKASQPETTSNNNESIISASLSSPTSIFEDNDFNQNNDLYLNDFQNFLSFASPFMSTTSTTARATTIIPPSSSSSSPSSVSGSSLSLSNYLKKILNYRIHLMIIAFLTYATLYYSYLPSSLSNVGSSSSSSSIIIFPISSYINVFLPLLIIELIEIPIFIQNPINLNRSPSAFIDIALLMQGISSNRTQYAYKLINIIGKILKDFTYFIFFFVFYHLIIINALSKNQIINQNHNNYDNQILSNNEQIINDINNNDNHEQFHYEI